MKHIVQLVGVAIWVAGIVIAKGFWSTFFAIFVPLWAWYVAIEHLLVHYGII